MFYELACMDVTAHSRQGIIWTLVGCRCWTQITSNCLCPLSIPPVRPTDQINMLFVYTTNSNNNNSNNDTHTHTTNDTHSSNTTSN